MSEYRVRWEIDVEADSPRSAARKARAAQTRPDTSATYFEVFGGGGGVELMNLEEEPQTPDERIGVALEAGARAFWDAVADEFTEIVGGDLLLGDSIKFDNAMRAAVKAWVAVNAAEEVEG